MKTKKDDSQVSFNYSGSYPLNNRKIVLNENQPQSIIDDAVEKTTSRYDGFHKFKIPDKIIEDINKSIKELEKEAKKWDDYEKAIKTIEEGNDMHKGYGELPMHYRNIVFQYVMFENMNAEEATKWFFVSESKKRRY